MSDFSPLDTVRTAVALVDIDDIQDYEDGKALRLLRVAAQGRFGDRFRFARTDWLPHHPKRYGEGPARVSCDWWNEDGSSGGVSKDGATIAKAADRCRAAMATPG